MKINNNKTRLLCISAAKSYVPNTFFNTPDGHKIESLESIKVLGFHFDRSPNFRENMRVIQRKFKSRVWALRHLKKNGFNQQELVKVYKTMVHPIVDYCLSVYHDLIAEYDGHELERIQMQAFKCIFGWKISYAKLLDISGVELLSSRLYRDGVQVRRTEEKFKIYRASTGRCLNSPLNLMRRELKKLEILPE